MEGRHTRKTTEAIEGQFQSVGMSRWVRAAEDRSRGNGIVSQVMVANNQHDLPKIRQRRGYALAVSKGNHLFAMNIHICE